MTWEIEKLMEMQNKIMRITAPYQSAVSQIQSMMKPFNKVSESIKVLTGGAVFIQITELSKRNSELMDSLIPKYSIIDKNLMIGSALIQNGLTVPSVFESFSFIRNCKSATELMIDSQNTLFYETKVDIPNSQKIISTLERVSTETVLQISSYDNYTSDNNISSEELDEFVFDVEQSVDDQYFDKLLLLDEGLGALWLGAQHSIESNNPDRVRHAITSLRELVTHILHILSPDKDVISWIDNDSELNNGKPTRRARLKFILKDFEDEITKDFIKKDINACLAMIDMYQKGTHKIRPNFSDKDLKLIVARTKLFIDFIIDASRGF